MNSYKFSIKFPNVSLAKGRYHIHCPEHIANTHKIGAPFFKFSQIGTPQHSKKACSIYFDCETMFNKFHVYMHSKSRNHSELMFTTHSHFLIDTIPILRLTFDVKGYDNDESHVLYVAFTFWNPLVNFLVPLFPLFVFINGVEDKLFFSKGKVKEHPLFALYRVYILMQALDLELN
jgi:hypothetical protein